MGDLTIRERLNQIDRFQLPHLVIKGDAIPKCLEFCIGTLEGNIPEIIVPDYNLPQSIEDRLLDIQFGPENQIRVLAKNLASALGTPKNARTFLFYSGGIPEINMEKVQWHAFYDPTTDYTHYFLMPSRKLLK